MKIFLTAFLLTGFLTAGYAQKVKPALNLTKGETYYSISIINSAISQSYNGQDISYNITMSAKTAYKVLDILDTVYSMEVSYKSIGMKMVSAQGSMDFNSDTPNPQDEASQVLAAMRDKPFLVNISKTGRVLAVKNIDKIMEQIFNSMPSMAAEEKVQLKNQFSQSFGEKAFKSNQEETMAIYPTVKVDKNDSWIIKTQFESAMDADIKTTYKLQDITNTNYIIHGDATVVTVSNKVNQSDNMAATYALTGTIVSDIKIDKTTGWVSEAKLKEDISGNLNVQDGPQTPGGKVIPMKVHTDITTTDM